MLLAVACGCVGSVLSCGCVVRRYVSPVLGFLVGAFSGGMCSVSGSVRSGWDAAYGRSGKVGNRLICAVMEERAEQKECVDDEQP